MIASFGDAATADLYHGVDSARARRWNAIARVAKRKLDMVNAAASRDDLKVPPGNRLEALAGDLAGFYGIRINDQWRVIFKWREGGAYEVKVTDYH